MPKVRSVSEAQDYLDQEFAWRLKEIADLKSAIRSTSAVREGTLLRAAVPLLYAHWEGFIKNAAEAYLSYVAHQRHTYEELQTCFVVRGLKRELDELSNSSSSSRNSRIVDFLLEELESRATIPYKGAVDTHSNVSSEVFTNIANSIGIDTTWYETKYNFIDESILNRRNKIAHGRYVDVGADEFVELSDQIIALLRGFKTDIENSLIQDSYTRVA